MVRKTCLMAAALILAGMPVTAQEPAQEPTQEPTEASGPPDIFALRTGAADFKHYCAVCHGLDATGDGPMAAELVRQAPDLTQLGARNDGVFPVERVFMMIDGRADVRAHGPREMPVWGQEFTRDETGLALNPEAEARIKNLAAYLKTLQQR